MSDLIERYHYLPNDDRLVVETVQDVEPYLRRNAEARAARGEHFGKYRGDLVHAASIPTNEVLRMRNGQCCRDGVSYDLFSPDREEVRRALLHVQSEHKEWLTVSGRPFAKSRVKWQ